jgi:hypothetical protein
LHAPAAGSDRVARTKFDRLVSRTRFVSELVGFPLQGSTKFTLRAEVFNVFNRVNFMNPNTTVTAPRSGRFPTPGYRGRCS